MSQGSGSACFGLQRDARAVFQEALCRCSVEQALAAKLHTGATDSVTTDAATLRIEGVRRLVLIAMGKGAATMLHAVLQREDIAAGRTLTGVLVSPEQPDWLPSSIQYFHGGHPTPDGNSRHAAEAILQLLRDEPEDEATLCLFLISGGASSMVELPLDGDISVDDTAAFHRALVHSGAPIVQMNALRKHFSAVKGGRLALAAAHLRSISLLMSDVPPDHLDALASGPTLPDSTTIEDCRRIVHDQGLREQLPRSVLAFFESDALPETPKAADLESRALLLLSQRDLAQAAADVARERGYAAVVDDTPDDRPVEDAAQYLVERFRALRRERGRCCLVSTGEVAVKLPEAAEKTACGGRNQQFVLECAVRLVGDDADLAVLSCGSDGVDGNSAAAGAVIASADFRTDEAQARAREALASFASNPFLRRMGAAIETGPTGLNLRDLRLLLG